jgi:hypothetical protein
VCKRQFAGRANDDDVESFGSLPFPFPFVVPAAGWPCAADPRGSPVSRSLPSPRAGRPVLPGRRSPARPANPFALYRRRASTRAGWRAIGVHGMLPPRQGGAVAHGHRVGITAGTSLNSD